MDINYLIKNWIEITGASLGIIYLYLEYKASFRMWPVGILMSLFYTYVYVASKFYSFAIINIYFILAGIYGWIKWSKSNTKEESRVKLRHCPKRIFTPILLALVVVFISLVLILRYFTDSTVTYGDSFVTTFSMVAMWMLAQRYVEQWILLIVLNIASVFIYFQQDLYATTIMYFIYSIVSCFGFIKWKNSVINKNNEII